jgi:ubiquinone/menaquinone biosynthesis C-methylase UbiE
MNLNDLQLHWNEFGKRDPLWAIITLDSMKGNKWDPTAFFESGQKDIQNVMQYAETLGLSFQRGRALDFGCGVGRLTQALANHFEEVVGVDIAPSMIKRAKRYNKFGSRCLYKVNGEDNLKLFSDHAFHFIYTNIVLQHMRSEYAKSYIKEFIRVLKPQGLLIFQMPSKNLGPPLRVVSSDETSNLSPVTQSKGIRGFIKRCAPEPWLRWYRMYFRGPSIPNPRMEMYTIERAELEAFLTNNGARIIDVVPDTWAGDSWEGFRYCVTKA